MNFSKKKMVFLLLFFCEANYKIRILVIQRSSRFHTNKNLHLESVMTKTTNVTREKQRQITPDNSQFQLYNMHILMHI